MATWRLLLEKALGQMAGVGLDHSDWVWGGGTVLMLRHNHRESRDIDVFLNDPQFLTRLSPRLNEEIERTASSYSESANHLRLEYADGEIDYLVVAPVIDDASEPIAVEGHGELPSMPDREIIAQKIYYRAGYFKGRDLFDFATIAAAAPETLQDVHLQQIGGIRRDALTARLNADGISKDYAAVIRSSEMAEPSSFEDAKTLMLKWLAKIEPAS